MMWLLLVVALFLGYVMFKPKKATKPASGGNDGTVNVSSSPNDAVLAATIAAAIAAREDEIAAVISATLAFHGLSSGDRIVAVKPLASSNWKMDARSNVVHQRDQMF
ncbi:MAG: hypothetical protein KBA38_02665 [Negativicutes bacterium]|jgi:hypothetical protein|nr:hypothetical protein [Negativicutes bacterium]